jgi:hypothetical protein
MAFSSSAPRWYRGWRAHPHVVCVESSQQERITSDAVEDFTPEQTAFLQRVRETLDAVLAGHDRAGLSPG